MKSKLKIWYIDFWPEWKYENFIQPILEDHFEIELNENEPDVVFYSIFGHNINKYKKSLRILYVGENIQYMYNDTIRQNIVNAVNLSHYTISFNKHSSVNFRLPIWQAFILSDNTILEKLINKKKFENFEKWCSFIVSNPSNIIRNSAYLELSKYRDVNSYGKLFNTDLSLIKMKDIHWRKSKEEYLLLHPHKFMITYENSRYNYYCTEKIMDSFLVGSMPIYWGDPKVTEDWNKNAFINLNTGNIVDEVRKIDKDNKLFLDKYNESVFTDSQFKNLNDNLSYFKSWLIDKIKHIK